ncbi:MAG: response regulator [Ignavibacteria bacterium]|nr:response regulator [Ignavibacteria bacterium]
MSLSYRVLVVDDSAHMRILLVKCLKLLGFEEVESAENGRVGVEKFVSFQPHIVFLDGIMPEMDGLTALREMKRQNSESIVVITSSLSERDKVAQFKESGADLYLLKPFDQAKFSEVAQRAVGVIEQRQGKA